MLEAIEHVAAGRGRQDDFVVKIGVIQDRRRNYVGPVGQIRA